MEGARVHEFDTLTVLVADRRRERESEAASMRLVEHLPTRRRAAGALRRLADLVDTPRVRARRPGLGTGRGS
jgi:hypothetical protein